METEESIRRRQQSDFASSEIGRRLLKGWTMLADECPGSTCYGIPLVRPQTAGRDKDPRKVCFSWVILKTDIVITYNRNVLYVALSTSQKQEKSLKDGIPWRLARYPGQVSQVYLWRGQVQQLKGKRKQRRYLLYRRSVLLKNRQ